jgi:hypothetical protein
MKKIVKEITKKRREKVITNNDMRIFQNAMNNGSGSFHLHMSYALFTSTCKRSWLFLDELRYFTDHSSTKVTS